MPSISMCSIISSSNNNSKHHHHIMIHHKESFLLTKLLSLLHLRFNLIESQYLCLPLDLQRRNIPKVLQSPLLALVTRIVVHLDLVRVQAQQQQMHRLLNESGECTVYRISNSSNSNHNNRRIVTSIIS